MQIKLKKLSPDAVIPTYATTWDAGADLYALDYSFIRPDQHEIIATGISLEIPNGFVGLIHPRSGMAAREGITVLNAPGTIDAGYRGEIQVILINHSRVYKTINKGDKIAQLVIQRVEDVDFIEVDELDSSERGFGKFGSTGV